MWVDLYFPDRVCVPCDYLYDKILYQWWSFLRPEAVVVNAVKSVVTAKGVGTAKGVLRTGVAWLEDGWLVKFVYLVWV